MSAAVAVTHPPMVAVVHPVAVVVHSANESEDNSPFQGAPPPKIRIRVLPRVRSARTRGWKERRWKETEKKVVGL